MKRIVIDEATMVGGYREESPRLAILLTVVGVVLVGAPLAFANKTIEEEGSKASDVSHYAQLAKQLEGNVSVVRNLLEKGVVKEAVINGAGLISAKGTTLITPHIVPTNINESTQDPNGLDVRLSAIYWNQHDPLVTIDDENYHVGDKVKGFIILEIRKTEVLFRSPAGEKVVKYFYDYLD